MIVRTNLFLCNECIDNPLFEGECACTVDMEVCSHCGNGPLNDGEDLCGECDA